MSGRATSPPTNSILTQPFGAANYDGMARKRFQRGHLTLRNDVWIGMWREDVIEDGKIKRVLGWHPLGTKSDYPTKKLALRALEDRLSVINNLSYRPRPGASHPERSHGQKREAGDAGKSEKSAKCHVFVRNVRNLRRGDGRTLGLWEDGKKSRRSVFFRHIIAWKYVILVLYW
jgi:hypothetical protein